MANGSRRGADAERKTVGRETNSQSPAEGRLWSCKDTHLYFFANIDVAVPSVFDDYRLRFWFETEGDALRDSARYTGHGTYACHMPCFEHPLDKEWCQWVIGAGSE